MSQAVPPVFIPALLCDDRLYQEVIASPGDQIEAHVTLSPQPTFEESVADLLSRVPERFVRNCHALKVHTDLVGCRERWEQRP